MKYLISLVGTLFIAGCTVVEQKFEDYQDVAAKFSRPDKIRVCYVREGETRTGYETRCFGEGCEIPPCP